MATATRWCPRWRWRRRTAPTGKAVLILMDHDRATAAQQETLATLVDNLTDVQAVFLTRTIF